MGGVRGEEAELGKAAGRVYSVQDSWGPGKGGVVRLISLGVANSRDSLLLVPIEV